MGTWGSGLYSGDFAMDLRATIGAVVRLPFDPDQLVEILCQKEPTAAKDPNDEDHTTFWLIVADQFAKRGIICDRVQKKAFEIIDAGDDVAMLKQLGMRESDLLKRRKLLHDVRTRIAASTDRGKPRTVLKKPQPLLMDIGDVIAYPTRGGHCINPYLPSSRTADDQLWMSDGWAAAVIIDRGRAFEFLSWYRPLRVAEATTEKPTLDWLRGEVLWVLGLPGTCSAMHFARMKLEKIGHFALDPLKIRMLVPEKWFSPTISVAVAVEDRSLGNELSATPYARLRPFDPTIKGIEQILHDNDQHPGAR